MRVLGINALIVHQFKKLSLRYLYPCLSHFVRQHDVYSLSDLTETKKNNLQASSLNRQHMRRGRGRSREKTTQGIQKPEGKKERTRGGWRRIRSKRAAVKGKRIELRRIWTYSGVCHQNATCRQQNTISYMHMRGFLFFCFKYKQSNVVKYSNRSKSQHSRTKLGTAPNIYTYIHIHQFMGLFLDIHYSNSEIKFEIETSVPYFVCEFYDIFQVG